VDPGAVGRLMRLDEPPPVDRWVAAAVVVVAMHSVAIGVVTLAHTEWALRLGGWTPAEPLFFVRQFAVFHLALAAAYLIEYFRYRGVSILVVAKTIALGSLLLALARGPEPWVVPFTALAEGLMAVGVAALARLRSQQPAPASVTTTTEPA
jgi:hypothetical protein